MLAVKKKPCIGRIKHMLHTRIFCFFDKILMFQDTVLPSGLVSIKDDCKNKTSKTVQLIAGTVSVLQVIAIKAEVVCLKYGFIIVANQDAPPHITLLLEIFLSKWYTIQMDHRNTAVKTGISTRRNSS